VNLKVYYRKSDWVTTTSCKKHIVNYIFKNAEQKSKREKKKT